MIEVGNFEDDWHRIEDADWIIEVVKEDLGIKREVLGKVAEHRKAGSIVSTNTSGLSLAAMVEGLDGEFRRHFLGTHFSNPPRYLHLMEIIPTADTDPGILAGMVTFVDRRLGKGVVMARDTPNFVVNRVGVYGIVDTLRTMQEMDLDRRGGRLPDRPADRPAQRAPPSGRRISVGLDTFAAVARNVYEHCPDDPSRDRFQPPEWVGRMIDAGLLGEKSGAGFYRKIYSDGRKKIETLDIESLDYREKCRPAFAELDEVRGDRRSGGPIPSPVSRPRDRAPISSGASSAASWPTALTVSVRSATTRRRSTTA